MDAATAREVRHTFPGARRLPYHPAVFVYGTRDDADPVDDREDLVLHGGPPAGWGWFPFGPQDNGVRCLCLRARNCLPYDLFRRVLDAMEREGHVLLATEGMDPRDPRRWVYKSSVRPLIRSHDDLREAAKKNNP